MRGMHDILPAEQPWWDKVTRTARDLAEFYGFGRIEPPILERADLFEKGTGAETDIVQKEMYTLRTRGGDTLALRPEFTPSVMRAYVEHGLSRLGQPQKLYSIGPIFRHEAPQLGRFRQAHQFNLEVVGGQNDPVYDAQVILIFSRLAEELRIRDIALRLNSIGCKVCRPLYRKQLQNYYKRVDRKICSDCARRLKGNPLRLLDCKREECAPYKAKTPNILDKICVTCSSHLKQVLEYLDELKISYTLDNQLVRGMDYYSRTVFELAVEGPGSELGSFAGGGRYAYLMEMLGGRATPAVGGAAGLERIILILKAQEAKPPIKSHKKVFLIHVGETAKKKSLNVIEDLRLEGIQVAESLGRESMKAQLKTADKEGFEIALIFGQQEVFEKSIIIRNLRTSLQETVPLERLAIEVKKRLRS